MPTQGAGLLDVSLTTRRSDPFVVAVDPSQDDPLLRTQLVSQPVMDLVVDIRTDQLTGFDARQGFTEIKVSGGHYRIHREQTIKMRDPDGRGVLTLEDLRYSTLPDLFTIDTVADEDGTPSTASTSPSASRSPPRSPAVPRTTATAR